eukprot:1180418-Pyramimonas_sp.AAC.1
MEAVQYWRYAKAWMHGPLATSTLSNSDKTTLLGNLEVRCVMFIHNKKARARRWFNTIGDIAQEFLNEVIAAYPSAKDTDLPWALKEAASTSAAPSSKMREYSDSGSGVLEKSVVEGLGFTDGA